MNIRKTIERVIIDNATLFGFQYANKDGNIDPDYAGPGTYLLYFDDKE